jgi:hypothetical protein
MEIGFIPSAAVATILINVRISCIEIHKTVSAIKDALITCTMQEEDFKIMINQ